MIRQRRYTNSNVDRIECINMMDNSSNNNDNDNYEKSNSVNNCNKIRINSHSTKQRQRQRQRQKQKQYCSLVSSSSSTTIALVKHVFSRVMMLLLLLLIVTVTSRIITPPIATRSSINPKRTIGSSPIIKIPNIISSLPRGGSSTNNDNNNKGVSNDNNEELKKQQQQQQELKLYTIQQQLLLNSRSLQLRQALIGYGIDELQHTQIDKSTTTVQSIPDWECSVATKQYPKSCLYTFDAEIGTKVIAPIVLGKTTTDNNDDNNINKNYNYQWITLSSLNRLRRNDITKVEPLWHNQYKILDTWFTPGHYYSLYQHLTPLATLISFILDEPLVLLVSLSISIILSIIVLTPILEYCIINFILTNKQLWIYWPNWSRFIHSALPLQLAIVQMILKFIQSSFMILYDYIRNQLVEYECILYEQCIPITYNENEIKQQQEQSITDTIVDQLEQNIDTVPNKVDDDNDDDEDDDDDSDNDDED